MENTRKALDKATITAIGVVVVLIAFAVAAVTLGSKPAQLDPASPAGVVQTYVQAVLDRDAGKADALLTSRARYACDRYSSIDNGIRVSFLSTDVYGSRALVRVEITTSSGDPFGGGWSNEDQFALVQDDTGVWKIDTVPWQVAWCPK